LSMLVDTTNSTAGAAVASAIRQAAQATGASFNYLLATAQVESGMNPQAGAPTSSARGLFQFIQQTWLATMKQAGAALGFGRYAAAITQNAAGHYEVRDANLRNEILALRSNPAANAAMAGAFTQANAAILTERLGRSPSQGELYIAHFFGAGGAARLINLAASNPNARAADFFPAAARANSSIFYEHGTGAARNLAQVRNILVARYELALRNQGQPIETAQAASEPAPVIAAAATAAAPTTVAAPATAPDTAGIAEAFASAASASPVGDRQIFHGLFTDKSGTGALAANVSALWGVPNAMSTASATVAQNQRSGSLLDLFRDVPVKGT
jgi:Transglycosylase SLT domain